MGVEQQLSDIIELLKKLNDSLEKLSKVPQYNINIEQVDLHDPVLEHLDFNLDSLDIEELSGALNLGNNFGVEIKKKESSGKKKAQEKKKKAKKEVKKLIGDIKKTSDKDSDGPSIVMERMDPEDTED